MQKQEAYERRMRMLRSRLGDVADMTSGGDANDGEPNGQLKRPRRLPDLGNIEANCERENSEMEF